MNVPEAVRNVDTGTEPALDEEPEARPEGPAPDRGADDGELPEVEEVDDNDSGGLIGRVVDWATRTPGGSYRDTDARDFWDPDGGGKNRLAHHLKDLVGAGDIPNGLGVLLAGAEMYYNAAQRGGGSSGSSDDNDSGSTSADADGYPTIQQSKRGGA